MLTYLHQIRPLYLLMENLNDLLWVPRSGQLHHNLKSPEKFRRRFQIVTHFPLSVRRSDAAVHAMWVLADILWTLIKTAMRHAFELLIQRDQLGGAVRADFLVFQQTFLEILQHFAVDLFGLLQIAGTVKVLSLGVVGGTGGFLQHAVHVVEFLLLMLNSDLSTPNPIMIFSFKSLQKSRSSTSKFR